MLDALADLPIYVYERSIMNGSLGTYIAAYYSHQHKDTINIAIDNHYVPQGDVSELLEYEHISIDDLIAAIKEL